VFAHFAVMFALFCGDVFAPQCRNRGDRHPNVGALPATPICNGIRSFATVFAICGVSLHKGDREGRPYNRATAPIRWGCNMT
jgi:hypothetical protein